MNYKNYALKPSYKNIGENSLSYVINDLLSVTKTYKRSVGFFTSTSLNFIGEGLIKLARNGGHIYLATSPRLAEEDIYAIKKGYDIREKIKNEVLQDFSNSLDSLEDENLKLLYMLIKEEIMDIKVVIKEGGIYHDKLWLLEDFEGNKLVFSGSPNETGPGYNGNYEKVRVFKSWLDPDGHVEDEVEEFASIWKDKNDFLKVFDFSTAYKNELLTQVDGKLNSKSSKKKSLRPYQEEAINAWKHNNYHGFFTMATGTGKTFTSIRGIRQLSKELENSIVVICAPYRHLVQQWIDNFKEDLKDENIKVIGVSSDYLWEDKLKNLIIGHKSNYKFSVIVSTIVSFFGEKFNSIFSEYNGKKILVVDEAHRFINYASDELKSKYDYFLGLSATPYRGNDISSGKKLMDWFGGEVFTYSLEKAIQNKYLVEYYYHPIYVHTNSKEEQTFKKLSQKMAACFKNGVLVVSPTEFNNIRNARLRIISKCEEKKNRIINLIDSTIKEKDHLIVYSGDGKLDDEDEDITYLQYIKNCLTDLGFYPAQFTCTETLEERMSRVQSFNNGDIDTLVAIRCLDEGIDIPSIKTALIISSGDNPKEFIQRRGRILRKYKDALGNDKKFATIFDVVVLPSSSCPNLAKIELKRFKEYNRLAINYNENLKDLLELCSNYNLDAYDLSYSAYEDNIDDGGDLDE